jgi:hypothetical protein
MCTSERKNLPSFSRKKTTPLHFERSIIMSNSLSPFSTASFWSLIKRTMGFGLIFLIHKRGRELPLGSRAIVGERSFSGAGEQISGDSGALGSGKHG